MSTFRVSGRLGLFSVMIKTLEVLLFFVRFAKFLIQEIKIQELSNGFLSDIFIKSLYCEQIWGNYYVLLHLYHEM